MQLIPLRRIVALLVVLGFLFVATAAVSSGHLHSELWRWELPERGLGFVALAVAQRMPGGDAGRRGALAGRNALAHHVPLVANADPRREAVPRRSHGTSAG